MIKYIGYIVILLLFLLVTFFGIGPVLMADGPTSERIATLAVVIVIYIILGLLLRYWNKRYR